MKSKSLQWSRQDSCRRQCNKKINLLQLSTFYFLILFCNFFKFSETNKKKRQEQQQQQQQQKTSSACCRMYCFSNYWPLKIKPPSLRNSHQRKVHTRKTLVTPSDWMRLLCVLQYCMQSENREILVLRFLRFPSKALLVLDKSLKKYEESRVINTLPK